ncbi:MAG: PIN domain-containing protein [Deltaproteobacteria bacterium]|nr:PIN domain-containing protein [Deltaproteobacteria bacterium]
MTGRKVLADTCIWIDYFRTSSPTSEELKKLIREEAVVSTGVVLLELLQGIKKPGDKNVVKDVIMALPFLDATRESWVLAGEIGFTLRKKGVVIPATDLLVAAVGKINGCAIFSIDAHFKLIPGLDLYSPS